MPGRQSATGPDAGAYVGRARRKIGSTVKAFAQIRQRRPDAHARTLVDLLMR